MVGLADHPFALHPLDDAGGAVVADLEMALNEAGRGLALRRHERHGPVVERILLRVLADPGGGRFGLLGDALDIVRPPGGAQEVGHPLDLGIAHEGPVYPRHATAGAEIEHVALAQQLLGAGVAEDGAAVDLGRDLEADPRREVGLDRAGDDIDRGPLRGHDQMDAGGAGHLRKPLHRALDVLTGDEHEIGHLVHHHDD